MTDFPVGTSARYRRVRFSENSASDHHYILTTETHKHQHDRPSDDRQEQAAASNRSGTFIAPSRPVWDPGPHPTHGSSGQPESMPQTAPRLVQPFQHSSWSCTTDRQTQRPRYVCSNRPQLRITRASGNDRPTELVTAKNRRLVRPEVEMSRLGRSRERRLPRHTSRQ